MYSLKVAFLGPFPEKRKKELFLVTKEMLSRKGKLVFLFNLLHLIYIAGLSVLKTPMDTPKLQPYTTKSFTVKC